MARVARRVWLWLGLNGVGNLVGFIPEDVPSHDPLLADEGQRASAAEVAVGRELGVFDVSIRLSGG